MQKEVLLTHNDLDGAGCRIIYEIGMMCTELKKGSEWSVFNCANSGDSSIDNVVINLIDDKIIGSETNVTIADICPSKKVLEKLRDSCKSVSVFDHHITAEYANNIDGIHASIVPDVSNRITINNGKESGTSLLWLEYVNKATDNSDPRYNLFDPASAQWIFIRDLVNLIRLYDTYEWKKEKNEDAKRLQTLWQLLRMDRFCNHYIDRIIKFSDESVKNIIDPSFDQFIDAKLEFAQEVINNFSRNDCYIFDVKGYKTALVVKATMANVSELAYQFLTANPDIEIFALFSLYDGGSFAFRTQKDYINLGKFAENLGGGGHPRSAGASVPKEILFKLYDDLYYWLSRY